LTAAKKYSRRLNNFSGCLPAAWESLEALADDLDTLGLEYCEAS